MDWGDYIQRGFRLILFIGFVLGGIPGTNGLWTSVFPERKVMLPSQEMLSWDMFSCPPGYTFCVMVEKCVHGVDGTCLPECEHDERLEKTSTGHFECVSDDDTEYISCPDGQVLCPVTDQCVNLDGTCPVPTSCGDGMVLCHGIHCTTEKECYDDDDDDDDDAVMCYPPEVFCALTDKCVNPDGTCPIDDTCPQGQEICWFDNGDSMCLSEDVCFSQGGTIDSDDDYPDADDEWFACDPGRPFCVSSERCAELDGSCPCSYTQEPCWSSGSKGCVDRGQCQMNRVRLISAGKFVDDPLRLKDHIVNQLAQEFQVPSTAFVNARISHDSKYFDFETSLPETKLDKTLQSMTGATSGLTDLESNAIAVSGFVIDDCDTAECVKGETEALCKAESERFCVSASLCIHTWRPCKDALEFFIVKFSVEVPGLFDTCVRPARIVAALMDFKDALKAIMTEFLRGMVMVTGAFLQPDGAGDEIFAVILEVQGTSGTITETSLNDKIDELKPRRLDGFSDEFTGGYFSKVGEANVWKKPGEGTVIALVYPEAVLANKKTLVDLTRVDLLPVVRTQTPLTLDCTGGPELLIKKPGETDVARSLQLASLTDELVISHSIPEMSFVKCTLSASAGFEAHIVFIAIPDSMNAITVSLRTSAETLTVKEDSGCHTLPEVTFEITDGSSQMLPSLQSWPGEMVKAREEWINVGEVLMRLANHALVRRADSIRDLRADIAILGRNNGIPAVSVKYKGQPLVENYKTNVPACSHLFQFCPKQDFSGNFQIQITPWIDRQRSATPLTINVQVVPVNDKPVLKARSRQINSGLKSFTAPAELDSKGITFSAGDVAKDLFHDPDGEDIGLGVIGYENSAVDGSWLWSLDGVTWTEIQEADSSNQVVLLNSDAKIKFKLGNSDIPPWRSDNAPQLHVVAWDTEAGETAGAMLDIQREDCPTGAPASVVGCLNENVPFLSNSMVALPMVRKGCDNVPNSGLPMLACGCGKNADACSDCNGDPDLTGEGAKLDVCGQCVGGNTGLEEEDCGERGCLPNCTDPVCVEHNPTLCDLNTDIPDECEEEGMVINKDFNRQSCTLKCIPENQKGDPCYWCGENTCIDCEGVNGGGKTLNLCDQCVDPVSDSSEDCAIGDAFPKLMHPFSVVNITLTASAVVSDSASPEALDCEISPDGEDTDPNIVAPRVSKYYIEGTDITLETVAGREDTSKSVGPFKVTCSLNGVGLPGAGRFTRIEAPHVTGIDPSEVGSDGLGLATISGTGFVNTDDIKCVVECDEDREVCRFGIPGEYISSTEVRCNMARLKDIPTGKVYKIHVTLDGSVAKDLAHPVDFTVRSPAPKVVKVLMMVYRCKSKIKVDFDVPISYLNTKQCSGYVASPDLSGARCYVHGKSFYILLDRLLEEDISLTLKNNVIKHADSEIADYFTDQVTATYETGEEEKPKVSIVGPDKVGCKPELIRVVSKHISGCHTIDYSWSVNVVEGDQADTLLNDNLNALTAHIAGKKAFQIASDQLLDGYEYLFTLTWSVGSSSGIETKSFMRDAAITASVEIVSFEEDSMVDPSKQLKIEARVVECLVELTDVQVSWLVTGPTVVGNLGDSLHAFITPYTLMYNSEYSIEVIVIFDGMQRTDTKVFRTQQRKLIPVINDGENAYKDVEEVEMDINQDVHLTCEEEGGDPNIKCFWKCQDNFRTLNEDDFTDCLDIEGEPVGLSSGISYALPASERQHSEVRKLRQMITLIMTSDESQNAVLKMIIVYENLDEEQAAPDIFVFSKDETTTYVPENDAEMIYEVDVYCMGTTRYKWESVSDGSWIEKSKIVLLEEYIPFNVANFVPCGLTFDLKQINVVPGELYKFTLTAINQKPSGTSSKSTSKTVQIYVVPPPTAGSIEFYSVGDQITAMRTEIKITLPGWYYDLSELECFVSYVATDGTVRRKLNALSVLPTTTLPSFTLPEGVYNFEAKCCNNFGQCATAVTPSSINVEALQQELITETVSQFTVRMKTNPWMVAVVSNMMQKLVTSSIEEEEKETSKQKLKMAASASISNMARTCTHTNKIKDKVATIKTVRTIFVDLSITSVADETIIDIRIAIIDLLFTATGQTSGTSRRKRSVTSQITSPGLSAEDSQECLLTYEDTYEDLDNLAQLEAEEFASIIDSVLIAMCQTGSANVMVADAARVDARVHKRNLMGTASTVFEVGCDSCTGYPAKVMYGSDLEAAYADSWSSSLWNISDICVASAQMSIDVYTPAVNGDAPTRMSDLVVLKMINPITYATESHTSLSDPVQFTMVIGGIASVNTTTFDYKPVPSQLPQIDGDVYKVTCLCNALGVIGVYEELKPEDEETTTTSSTSTTTTMATTPTTTTPIPAKFVSANVDHLTVKWSFSEEYNVKVPDTAAFEAHCKGQVVSQVHLTGFAATHIQNLQAAPGSILVSFEVHSTGQPTLGQMLYALEDLINSGTASFTSVSGDSLNIVPGSFTYSENTNNSNDDDSDMLPYIIGGVLGGLVIIGVVIIVVVLILKHNSPRTTVVGPHRERFAVNLHSSEIPDYVLAPPPPYIYDTPPAFQDTNKWVENEMTDQEKKKFVDGSQPTNSRTNSRTSIQKNSDKKERESAPTPVGE